MKNNYVESIFLDSVPKILDNENLRLPQQASHSALYNHFIVKESKDDAIVVLPTGVGKTGLMAIAPYFISKGRVLLIAPSLAIKNELISNFDPNSDKNFLLKFGVFEKYTQLPTVIEYESDTKREILDKTNLVILNVHKLQERLDSSLIHKVEPDFFDLIIIDEAHHSVAETWTNTLSYFNKAKVIKVTGTPFRSDGLKIKGKLTYHYSLARAMHNEYVKSLENIVHVPGELKLTIDGDDKEYTIEEIYSLGLKDSEWVTRSIAYSEECSQAIVSRSMNLLKEKKDISNLPHKIIAVACSIRHAKQIKQLYQNVGLRVSLVHSELSNKELNIEFENIESHLVDVVVHVAMLGEGYDHSYLSIAAIFRPFRDELPYIQFIGRILRYIHNTRAEDSDNVGHIVVHDNLELDSLWERYKKEIEKSIIIKELLTDYNIIMPKFGNYEDSIEDIDSPDYGNIIELGESSIKKDVFTKTQLLERAEAISDEEDKELIKSLMSTYNQTEENARLIARQMNVTPNDLRPDLAFQNTQEGFNLYIHEEVIPDILSHFNVQPKGNELSKLSIFNTPLNKKNYSYIIKYKDYNSAYLGFFFNTFLKNTMGKPRSDWNSIEEFNMGYDILEDIIEYIRKLEI